MKVHSSETAGMPESERGLDLSSRRAVRVMSVYVGVPTDLLRP